MVEVEGLGTDGSSTSHGPPSEYNTSSGRSGSLLPSISPTALGRTPVLGGPDSSDQVGRQQRSMRPDIGGIEVAQETVIASLGSSGGGEAKRSMPHVPSLANVMPKTGTY